MFPVKRWMREVSWIDAACMLIVVVVIGIGSLAP
jgi:hypothetical protein